MRYKGHHQEGENQQDEGKYLQIVSLVREFYPEHIKILQLNNKKNNPIEDGPRVSADISPQMMYKQPISTLKDAQHGQTSEKCKSKPQSGTTSHPLGSL